MEVEAEIDRLPVDLLANIFVLFTSFTDLAQASGVCKKWKQGVNESLACRQNLSFAGWKMDDDSTARLTIVLWSCRHVTENGLFALVDKCLELKSMNVWGTRVPVDCINNLLILSPALEIKV
ncbi:hypothetical protein ACSQ67_002651 [Phaseolus vulgaris]